MKTIATLTLDPAIHLHTEVEAIVRDKTLRRAEPTFDAALRHSP